LINGLFSKYSWGNGSAIIGNTEVITVNTTGTYTVTVTNSWGCTATAQAYVTIGTTAKITEYCCNNIKGLALCATASASYQWGPNIHYPNIQCDTVTTPGTYCVTVTSIYGCTAATCINVAGVCAPPVGRITGLGHTAATISWNPVPCALGYTVCISEHNCFCPTCYNISNTHYTFSGLKPNTCYDVIIRTDCTKDDSTSVGSDTMLVCTLDRLMAGESDNSTLDLNVYPNPTQGSTIVEFSSTDDGNYNIRMVDVLGRTLLNEDHTAVVGVNQVQLNLGVYAKGLYFLIFDKGDQKLETKIIVQ
jgi:hypothetical protein